MKMKKMRILQKVLLIYFVEKISGNIICVLCFTIFCSFITTVSYVQNAETRSFFF